MIILDPVTASDATFARASTGTYYDAAGALQTAAADVLRVTYDPADLAAAPRALIEGAATNLLTYSEQFDNAAWTKANATITANAAVAPDGTMSMDKLVESSGASAQHYAWQAHNGASETTTLHVVAKAGERSRLYIAMSNFFSAACGATFDLLTGLFSIDSPNADFTSPSAECVSLGSGLYWCKFTVTKGSVNTVNRPTLMSADSVGQSVYGGDGSSGIYIWGAQLEMGSVATSYIPTTTAPVTRAADIIGATGTVLGSNVAEADAPAYSTSTVYAAADQVVTSHLIYESKVGARAAVTMTIAAPCVVTWTAHGLAADTPISFATTGALPTGLIAGTVYYVLAPTTDAFNLSSTPGGAAITTTGTQSGVHTATASLNLNKAVTDTTHWLLIGATNARKMLDAYNNTQTTNADAIILVMTPRQISQGLYLGNLDANSVSVAVHDATEGIVYTETQSLIVSDSAASFFNWFFKRIRRKTYFFTALLPVYANATVTITISKAGSTAKCGMCTLGPLIDVGLSEYGLSTEIKDYSSTTFAFDGTSSTVQRGYAKRMSLDLLIDNELIDSIQEQLADFRQKTVVFVGATMYGSAIVCGKYSSFKNVIAYLAHSKMAMQIEGVV